MTGLNVETDRILELAVILTDTDFKMLGSFHRIIYQPPKILEVMDTVCKKMHEKSGLIHKIAGGVSLCQAERELNAFVDAYFEPSERIILVGNSIGNDKRFIEQYMPTFAKRLHYRVIDVSSFKEVFRTKYHCTYDKKNQHRAIDDIHESIQELHYYLSFVHYKTESAG